MKICYCCGDMVLDKDRAVCNMCERYGGSEVKCCKIYPDHITKKGVEQNPNEPVEGKDFYWEHEYRVCITGHAVTKIIGKENMKDYEILDKADYSLYFDDLELSEKELVEKNVRKLDMSTEKEFDLPKWETENGICGFINPADRVRKEKSLLEF